MIRKIIRVAVFCALGFAGFIWLNKFVRPFWPEWNNFYTHKSFYRQPKNTIQVAALGSSIVVRGFDPMLLYEKYGICAYNYATEQQPLLGSYYLLQEIYNRHPDSLKNVILECHALIYDANEAFYRKSIEPLHFSKNKFDAAKETVNKNKKLQEKNKQKYDKQKYYIEILSYLLPLVNYHVRWKNLSKSDFIKFNEPSRSYRRGYEKNADLILNKWATSQQVYLPFLENADAEEMQFNEWSVLYLKQIADFCKEKKLNLILFKSPIWGWNARHNITTKRIATELGITFLDMNTVENFLGSEFDYAINVAEGVHLNFWGAEKVTSYVGKYMMENFPVENITDDEKYSFLKNDLAIYRSLKNGFALTQIAHIKDFLSHCMKEDISNRYNILISVRDEAANTFDENLRKHFADLGFATLADLQYRDSYIAVVENGKIIFEQKDHGKTPIKTNGTFADGTKYFVESGGAESGNVSHIQLEGKEYSPSSRGLNFVIYDKVDKSFAFNIPFDTCASPDRKIIDEEKYAAYMQKYNFEIDFIKWGLIQ